MHRKRLCLLILLASFALAAHPASAGVDRFTRSGPWRGPVLIWVADPAAPQSLLALADFGPYRSDDGGRSWAWSGAGLDPDLQQGIVADPANPGSFYLVTVSKVFHSADHGRSWARVASGLNFQTPIFPHARTFPSVALLPAGPGRAPTLLVGTVQNLQRSGDGGATWSTVYTSSFLGLLRPVADPGDPQRVWLDAPGVGLLLSVDGGQTWNPVPNLPENLTVNLVLPTRPATILATGVSGLWKSTDQGATWRKVAGRVQPTAYETQTPSIVYGTDASNHFFWSADAAETWSQRGAGLPSLGIMNLLAAPGSRTLYTLSISAFSTDIYTSPDRGRHWSRVAATGLGEFLDAYPTRLRFQPGEPQTLYALRGGKAYRSANGGATWESLLGEPLHSSAVFDLIFDSTSPDFLYAAAQAGFLRSTDGGETWDRLSPQSFTTLAQPDRRTLLAAACAISRSRDGGRTWTVTLACPAAGRQIDHLFVDPRNPRVVYAAGVDLGIGFFPRTWKSADGGATWKQLLPDSEAVAVDPSRAGRLYAARPAGFQRSDDGGLTFRTISDFGARTNGNRPDVQALLVDPASPQTLYAATANLGVFRSTDGGVTWAPVNGGLLRYASLRAFDLIADPAVAHRIFAVVDGALLESRFTGP